MPNRSLQFVIGLLIIVVSFLFIYSLFNPLERDRQMIDKATLTHLSAEASGSARCFKPISKYYQEDPHTIYNSKGLMSFEGFYCLN
ncbi:MAG: hypothetical protein NT141_00225 [candidate division WWE3 bacterium]|nr:hypothetical protein [candidate division WWE3 bacterium]